MEKVSIEQAIISRHSVRRFIDKPIEDFAVKQLNELIEECNALSGVNFQLITNEPNAFNTLLAKYGKFKNVNNYVAVVVKKQGDYSEAVGYYGERLVLKAQQLGLNTCWAGISYSKSKCKAKVCADEKLFIAIALGYGETQGVPHKSRPLKNFYHSAEENIPEWFLKGVEFASLCPTAINQQKFFFELDGNTVKLSHRFGPFSKTDLGIAKLHFEIGAGMDNFLWRK